MLVSLSLLCRSSNNTVKFSIALMVFGAIVAAG
jgi:hypothetical protein